MKKFVIACAVILAGVLSSCGDTNYCYEVTATINVSVLGATTSQTLYVWGTSNDLEATIAELDANMKAAGISKDSYKIKHKRTKKSQSDCY